jgi:hypothetical protein
MPPVLNSMLGENNWKILIIEQSDKRLFNRGKLLNCGYLLSNDLNADFFFHDIDTIPVTPDAMERYKLDCKGQIIGIYNSICNTLGGIIKCSGEHFKLMNGFPNSFWGWGCEDKALQNRMEIRDIHVNKRFLDNDEGKIHFKVNDKSDRIQSKDFNMRTWREYNLWNSLPNEERFHIMDMEGVNNCSYEVEEKTEISPGILLYKVKI